MIEIQAKLLLESVLVFRELSFTERHLKDSFVMQYSLQDKIEDFKDNLENKMFNEFEIKKDVYWLFNKLKTIRLD